MVTMSIAKSTEEQSPSRKWSSHGTKDETEVEVQGAQADGNLRNKISVSQKLQGK